MRMKKITIVALSFILGLCAQDAAAQKKTLREKGMNVIAYTGYTFEYLKENADGENGWGELLELTDFLVDGKFELEKRSLALHFRGSSNQRIIDVQQTLKSGEITQVEW